MPRSVEQKTGRQLAELMNLDLLPIKDETIEKILKTFDTILPFSFTLTTKVINNPCQLSGPEKTGLDDAIPGNDDLLAIANLPAPGQGTEEDCGCGGGGTKTSSTSSGANLSKPVINPAEAATTSGADLSRTSFFTTDPGFLASTDVEPFIDGDLISNAKLCCKYNGATLEPTMQQDVKVERTVEVTGLINVSLKGSVAFNYFLIPDPDVLGRTVCANGCCDNEIRRVSVHSLLTCSLSFIIEIVDPEKLFGADAKTVDVSTLGNTTKVTPGQGVQAAQIDASNVKAQDLKGGKLELSVSLNNLPCAYDFIHTCTTLAPEQKKPKKDDPGTQSQPENTNNPEETAAPEPIDKKDNCDICDLNFTLKEFLMESPKLIRYIETQAWPDSFPYEKPTSGAGGILNHFSAKEEQGGWFTAIKKGEKKVNGKTKTILRYRYHPVENDIPSNAHRTQFPLIKAEKTGLPNVPLIDEPGRCLLTHFHTHPNLFEEFSFSEQAVFGDGGASDLDIKVAKAVGLPFFIRGRDKNKRDCYYLYDIDCKKKPEVVFKPVQKLFATDLIKFHKLRIDNSKLK